MADSVMVKNYAGNVKQNAAPHYPFMTNVLVSLRLLRAGVNLVKHNSPNAILWKPKTRTGSLDINAF